MSRNQDSHVTPSVGHFTKNLLADLNLLLGHELATQMLVEASRGIVRQDPDQHRAVPGVDQPTGERGDQSPPDSLPVPLGKNVEAAQFAPKILSPFPLRPTVGKTHHAVSLDLGNEADLLGLLEDLAPSVRPIVNGEGVEEVVGHNASVRCSPRLDLDTGDGWGVVE